MAVLSVNTIEQMLAGMNLKGTNQEQLTVAHLAAAANQAEALSTLLARDASTCNVRDRKGKTPLHYASLGQAEAAARVLLDRPEIGVNAQDDSGSTPLHVAAVAGSAPLTALLCNGAGIQVDARARDGSTPLHMAFGSGHEEVASLLLASGADIQAAAKDGSTPVHLAIKANHGHMLQFVQRAGHVLLSFKAAATFLHQAVLQEKVAIVRYLLSIGFDANGAYGGCRPLWRTVGHRTTEIVQALLDAGADVQASDAEGRTIFHLIGLHQFPAGLEILLQHLPSPDESVNRVGGGMTPLHGAVEAAIRSEWDSTMIDILLAAGADPKMPQDDGMTALRLCAVRGRRDLFDKMLFASLVHHCEPDCERGIFFQSLPEIVGDTAYPPIQLPLLCREILEKDPGLRDLEVFSNYPQQRGWAYNPVAGLHLIDTTAAPSCELASFMQEWLIFGMIKAFCRVFETRFDIRHFVRMDRTGQLFIHAAELMETMQGWAESEARMRSQDKGSGGEDEGVGEEAQSALLHRLNMIDNVLRQADQVINDQFTWERVSEDKIVLETSLAAILLGEILSTFRNKCFETKFRMMVDKDSVDPVASYHAAEYEADEFRELDEDRHETALNFFHLSSRFTYQKMLALGWCLNEVEALHSLGIRTSILYYMSLLPRPMMISGHLNCTRFECLAMQVDENNYDVKHVKADCNCPFRSVPLDQLDALLDQKKIPLVEIIDDGNDTSPLRIEVGEESTHEYVAISHVWCQGLGNPKANALPECQLRRLNKLAQQAWKDDVSRVDADAVSENCKPILLWVDSLCVPITNPGRKIAIQLMYKTYQSATVTLVLESELQNVASTVSHAEKLSRILMSAWMRRLWTLQEGLTGQGHGLRIQLKDQSISYIYDLMSWKLMHANDYFLEKGIFVEYDHLLGSLLPPLWKTPMDAMHRLVRAATSLSLRTTTKAEDEFICLSSILQLDVKKILSTEGQQRAKVFYSLLGDEAGGSTMAEDSGIPMHVLHMGGPRLSDVGFRWAPQSFIAKTRSDILTFHRDYLEVPPAFVTSRGLIAQMEGYIIDAPRNWSSMLHGSRPDFAIVDEAREFALLIMLTTEEWKDLHWSRGQRLAVLRQPHLTPHALVILVEEQDDEGGVIVGSYLCQARAQICPLEQFRLRLSDAVDALKADPEGSVALRQLTERAKVGQVAAISDTMEEDFRRTGRFLDAKRGPDKWCIT